MKHLPQFFAAAGLALAAALFAVPADEARAHSAVTVTNHPTLPFAARDGEWDVVNHFIAEHNFDEWNVQHDTGDTALNFAANSGHISIALTLIALSVSVNVQNIDKLTPLHGAALHDSIPLAEALISAGASVNATLKESGRTPLAYAGVNENTAVFPVLIWAGGHWGKPCADGEIASMVRNDAAGSDPWPPSPKCVPGPKGKCTTANWSYTAGQEACVINSYEGGRNPADSGRSKCRTPATPAGMADASPLCSAAFGPDWDFPTKPTTGDTSPYYPYNCDPDGTRGLIPATVNTIGATECACADADKVVIGGRQVGVSGTTVTVTVGGRCAVCPDDHILPSGACAAAALTAANAALLAEVGKDFPDVADVAAVRRALDGGANPNITTSAGIPVLVAAALGLHAEVISVLITAGADSLVKVAGIRHAGYNSETLSAFIPGALVERAFRDRSKPNGEFPIGRRLAEAIIHFGDAAGDRFDWGAVDRTRDNGGVTYTYTAGELVLGYMQITRLLGRNLTADQLSFLDAIGRYVRARGEICQASWYGTGVGGRYPTICTDSRTCSSKDTYSCSRACDGLPRLARKSATCVSACGKNEHAVAVWPDSQCQCVHGAPDAQGDCPALQIEQDLLDEVLEEAPRIATVRALLSQGARANLTLDDGRPLIFAAVSLRHADVVSVLVTAGADPNVRHNFGSPGAPEFHSVPGRILSNANERLASGGDLTKTAQLMIHFAEAVKIAAAASNVSFPWGSGGSFSYLRQAYQTNAAAADPGIADELSFIGGYLLDQGAPCGGGLTVGTAAHTALCLSRRSCELSDSSVTVVSSCGACAGSPLRTAAGAACAAACGDNQIEGAAAGSWGERQCEFLLATVEYAESPRAGGTLTASVPSGGTTLQGSAVTFTAAPAAGWVLTAWAGDAENCAASDLRCVLTADADLHVTAVFLYLTVMVEYAESPRAGGTLTASVPSGGTTLRGSDVTFTAAPATGWALTAWAGDAENCAASDLRCVLTADADLHVTAVFSYLTVTVEYAESPRAGGTLTASVPSGGTTLWGSAVTFTAAPAAGWALTAWAGDAENCAASDLRCVLTADADLHVTAVFSYLTVTVEYAESPRAGGTLTASVPSGGTTLRGSDVTFTAAPATGWALTAWAGDAENCAASDLRCVLTADANLHVTAVFSYLTVTVEYAESPRAGGTLTASVPSGGMTLRGSAVTFTAAPAAGWTLTAWAGDDENCAASDLQCVLTADADLHVTATFAYVGDCDVGETGVWLGSRGLCVPDADVAEVDACAAAGWDVETKSNSQAPYLILICAVPALRYVINPHTGAFIQWFLFGNGVPGGCIISVISGSPEIPTCVDIFGDPPQFPEMPTPFSGHYVSNCSFDGGIPAIPADINTMGEKKCRCAEVDGYTGDDWPDNCCSPGQELKDNVCAAIPTFAVEYRGTPDGGGAVTASIPSGGTTLQGATTTFTATPAAGWYVAGWNRADCVNIGAAATPGEEKECVLTVDADLFVTAAFAEARTVVYQAGVSASLADGGGNVSSGDTFADGVTIAFLATPPENQEVAWWTNNGATVCVGQNPCLLEVSGDLNVQAEFASLLRTIIYAEETPPGRSGGTLTASIPSGGTALRGATVTFTATPAAGWYVEEWTGDGAGCAPSAGECEATVDGDLFVTVRFAETQVVASLRYEARPAAGGTVTVAGLIGDTVVGGSTVTFLATPATGWYVAGWNRSDCANIGAAATPGEEQECILTADGDLFVRAVFAEARTVFYEADDEADVSASLADGGVTVNSGDTVADGVTIAFLATPPDNQEVAQWTKNGAAVCVRENPCLLAADGGLSVRAEFAPIMRMIAYAGIPDGQRGGTLTASVPSGGTAPHGATATFTATPAAGWYVAGWNYDDCANVGAAATPGVKQECALTVDADLFVTATFAEAWPVVYEENISASLADGGGRVNSGDTFADGVTIAFSATPPENHMFVGWTNNGVVVCGGQNPCLLAVDGGLSVRAGFAPIMRTIAYAEIPDGQRGGIVTSPIPSGRTAPQGGVARFTATPEAGWYVAGWNYGDCANVGAAADPGIEQECVLTVDADLYVTVTFAEARTVVYGADVSASLADGGGNVNSGDTVADGTTIAFLATPPENHVLAGWTNNGEAVCDGQNPCLLAADGDLNVEAEFASLLRTITYTEETLGENVGRGGDLTASVPSGGTTPLGTTVTFTATPAGGYYVEEWTGDGAGCAKFDRICEVVAGADLFVTVRFAETQDLSALNYAALPAGGAGGTLTVDAEFSGGDNMVVGGATVTFLATPAAGWIVAAWEGDVGSCAAPDMECALRANRDLFVTVHFAQTVRVEHRVFPEDGRGGTLTIAGLAGEDFAYAGATLTFRALPATRWDVTAWEGNVEGCAAPDLECAVTVAASGGVFVTVRFGENCAAKNRQPGGSPSVNGLAPDGCGACMDDYGRFGRTGDLCAEAETGDFGGIAQQDVCLELQEEADAQLEGNGRVCSGVDANDTFCILDSADGLPCRGLLRHVLKCNVGWNRPALNPFFCGAVCLSGEQAVGKACAAP